MKQRTTCLLAAAMVLSAASAAGAEQYTIAAGKALTGFMAFVGVPEANAIRMGVDELNAAHYLGDDTLALIVNDDGSDKGQLLTLINRAATVDKALMFLGPASSVMAAATAPVINDLKLPMFGTAQSAEPLKSGPWYFKVTVSPQGAVLPVSKYAVDKLDIRRPAIIYCRDNDGHVSNMRTFRDYVTAHGRPIVDEESILTSDTDFSAVATKLAAADPDSIFLAANAVQAANVAIQLKEAGVSDQLKIIGTAGLGDDYIKAGGKAVDNTYSSTDYNVQSTAPMNVAFVDHYRKLYGIMPDNWAAVGYTQLMISARAIKQSLPNPTREKVRDAITHMRDVPVLLGNGVWNTDENRIPYYDSPIVVIRGGKIIPAP